MTWILDELAHAGHEHLDAAYVAGYEAKAGYDPQPDVERMRDLGLDAASTIVDLGAGTGVFAAAVAAHAGRVVAVDISPAMVDALRRRTRHLANVEIVRAGFLTYEHAGQAPDFVFTRNALHQLPDFWKGVALARVAAMLRPGGIVRLHDLVFDFEPADAERALAAWMAGAVDDPARGWTAAELAEHVRLEHSTYSWLFEPLLQRTGFEILDAEYRRGAYGAFTLRRAGSPNGRG
jgi:SAM-dependent methyltransferase